MPGTWRGAPHNTRLSCVITRVSHAWLVEEARRIDAGLTVADVVRGAIAYLRMQPDYVREAVIKATKAAPPDEEAGSGQDQRV